jgi:hypothetical protein
MNSVTLLNGLKALEDAIASDACSLKALACMHVANSIPLGCPLPLTFTTVNSVQTLKGNCC